MSHTNPALAAAAAQIARSGLAMQAQRAAADSALAQRIIAANPRPALGYGMTGGAQMFLAMVTGPTLSDLKRRAAESILAHRGMWAAGGRSDRWLNQAAAYRRAAMAASVRVAPFSLAAE